MCYRMKIFVQIRRHEFLPISLSRNSLSSILSLQMARCFLAICWHQKRTTYYGLLHLHWIEHKNILLVKVGLLYIDNNTLELTKRGSVLFWQLTSHLFSIFFCFFVKCRCINETRLHIIWISCILSTRLTITL